MRILVIDDNIKTNTYLSQRLKAEYFAVDSAHDAKEGLYLGRLYPYDVVLMDKNMPPFEGTEILRTLRQEGYSMPIIIISAYVTPQEKIEMLALGAQDVLEKPFIFEDVLARIHAFLRRQDVPHKKPLVYKHIRLDFSTSQVYYHSQHIPLTRNEFACIECLIQAQGRPVSRQDMYTYVWNTEDTYSSNTVETHILNIRKKAKKYNIDIIKTIPHQGYILS